MKKRRVALIVPYTSDGRILLQDRRDISKIGEEWGFFGGGIESGETPEQALLREVKEELSVELVTGEYQFVGEDVVKWTDSSGVAWQFPRYFYSVKYENLVGRIIQAEGNNMGLFTIEEAKKMNLFTPENPEDPALDIIKKSISKNLT